MKPNPLPAINYLNECLTYDPSSGNLFWKERPRSHFDNEAGWIRFNRRFSGKIAGTYQNYPDRTPQILISLAVNGTYVKIIAARVIYAIMMGNDIPFGFEIDHKDCNGLNNKWTNLRLATRSQNGANRRRTEKCKNKYLPKGVYPQGKKFYASIGHEGKTIRLGTFGTAEEAHTAYCYKAAELYGEFARFN